MSKNKTDAADDGYGISYIAKELDMDPSNVRNALRRLKVEKTDNRYSWSRKSEADAIVKRIKDNKREQPEALKKANKPAKDAKPSKEAKVNKDAKERAGKAAKDAKASKADKKGKDKPAKADKKSKKDDDEE